MDEFPGKNRKRIDEEFYRIVGNDQELVKIFDESNVESIKKELKRRQQEPYNYDESTYSDVLIEEKRQFKRNLKIASVILACVTTYFSAGFIKREVSDAIRLISPQRIVLETNDFGHGINPDCHFQGHQVVPINYEGEGIDDIAVYISGVDTRAGSDECLGAAEDNILGWNPGIQVDINNPSLKLPPGEYNAPQRLIKPDNS